MFNFDFLNTTKKVKSGVWKSANLDSLGSLWIKMLAFYSIDFGLKKNYISIRFLKKLPKSDVKMYTKKMAIEDPFMLNVNLSRHLMTQTNKHIINVFCRACLYFAGTSTSGERVVEKLVAETGLGDLKKLTQRLGQISLNDEDTESGESDSGESAAEDEDLEHEEEHEGDFLNDSQMYELIEFFEDDANGSPKKTFRKRMDSQRVIDRVSKSSDIESAKENSKLLSDTNIKTPDEADAVKKCLNYLVSRVEDLFDSVYGLMPNVHIVNQTIKEKTRELKFAVSSFGCPKVNETLKLKSKSKYFD